jgi:hypothetical protein
VQQVLDKVQGCPSFQPVVAYELREQFLDVVVPALPGNLVPLTELVQKMQTSLNEAGRLHFILTAARHFNDFLLCLEQRHVVWVAPRWATVYAAVDPTKQIEYLVAPGTQVVNMFVVSQFVPHAPRRRFAVEECVAELWFAFAGDTWDTLDVNNLVAYDFFKLAGKQEKAAQGVSGARGEFIDAFNTLLTQL